MHARPLPWRTSYDPWQVWVSEVMLQQTRMEVVLPYFERFISRYPAARDLARAEEEEVLSLWSGLGYYRRARMLRQGAIAVIERFAGRIPETVEELCTLPGVGRYTAGAISSIAFNRTAPIVDGNIERLLSRLHALDDALGTPGLARRTWELSRLVVETTLEPRSVNQAMMEVGATICTPRAPRCGECPLRSSCSAAASGDPLQWPRPRQSVDAQRIRVPLLLTFDPAARVLLVRNDGPLLGGMYHLPHGNPLLIPALDFSSFLRPLQALGMVRHSITSRRLEFALFEAELRPDAGDRLTEGASALWLHSDELHTVPHPSYVRKALFASAAWESRRGGDDRFRASRTRMGK